jgi:uncharacterized membrane protein YfcA
MDDLSLLQLGIFVVATFLASLVAGLVGFAFGLIAAAVWLHMLSPAETAALIVAFGLIVQGVSVWKLRAALRFPRLLPFVLGAIVGVPLGVLLLRWAEPSLMRAGVGAVLIAFSLYSLARPQIPKVEAGRAGDAAAGLLNGVLGGATGLAGILVTVWSGLRGWPKDEQRAVFQPVGVTIFALTALWLSGAGLVGARVLSLFLVGLPAVLAGT